MFDYYLWLSLIMSGSSCRLLQRFYSKDARVLGTLSDNSHHSPLGLIHTVPAFLFWLSLNVPFLGTPGGRAFYWKTAVFAIVTGWVWITIRF